jgi:glucose/arabinose dehydrogenase
MSRFWGTRAGALVGALVTVGSLAVGSLVAPAASAAGPAQDPPTPPERQVRVVATGLEVPWALDFLPDGSALVTERNRARLVRVTTGGEATPVGTVPGVVPGGEGGLMGVAVSPDFATDALVYLYLTAASDNRIVRARYANGSLGTPEVVLGGIPKGFIHNGGRIAFGPDGMLYAGTGETGNTALAQDRSSLGGKILRMTPDGDPAPGNPFGTLVWSYGHRNVQGFSWDDAGRMYATEFGQNTFDEVNRIEGGRNYGWPIVEGRGGAAGMTDPLVTWTTAESSPSGAAVLGDSLWVAALRGQRLWRVPLDGQGGAGTPSPLLAGEYGRLRAVAAAPAPDGTLWVTTSNRDGRGVPAADDDRVLAVAPGSDPGPGPGPARCVTATNQAHVTAGRATSFFFLAWAAGSGNYLGLVWATTSLRQSATSDTTWELVASCEGGSGSG